MRDTRYKSILIVVFLIFLWNIASWHITKSYYDARFDTAIEQETQHSQAQAGDLADSILRNLSYLHGISDLLSQVTQVRGVISRFEANTAPSTRHANANKKYWTSDPELRGLDEYLYYAHLGLQADLIYVANAAGDVVAASNYEDDGSAVGASIASREFFGTNKSGQRGMQYAVGMTTNVPGIYFSTPIMVNHVFQGAVVVKVNIRDLTFLFGQIESFLADANGVIILSKGHELDMHSLPGAAISRMPVSEKVRLYKRSAFPEMEIGPWDNERHRLLRRIQGENIPHVLISKGIPEYGLTVYVTNDVHEFDSFAQYRLWVAVLLGLLGSVLILIGGGAVDYLNSIKKSRELLREQKNQLETFLQASNDGIHILDADGRLIMANDRFFEMLGYTAEEMSRINVAQWEKPASNEDANKRINRLTQVKEGDLYETRYCRKDGRETDVEISAVPVEIGGKLMLYGSARDVSERKRLEEELSLATLIVKNSSEGMMVGDAENRIISINPAFTNITGYSLDDVKGKSPLMFDSGRHSDAFYEMMRNKLKTSGHWQGEIWEQHKNGTIQVKMQTTNTICNSNGEVYRYVTLFSDITEKKQTEELISRQANFDALTELPNRRMFQSRLEQEIIKSARDNLSLALFLIDLDQFKEVNDTLGHDKGDALLQEAALRISSCVRGSDMVARLGGDEFSVIFPSLSDKTSHIEDCAQRILKRLAEPFQLDSEVIHVSASIGITLCPDDGAEIDVLMKNADQAMYLAKKKGRNRFSYFTKALQQEAQKRMRLIHELRQALANDQFRVYFQPVVDMASGRIQKAEALLRWQHPDLGMVPPLEFIPLAEEIGLINEIGDWVFKESARWAKRWAGLWSEDFQVSVNISPVQFMTAENICEDWRAYLKELELPGGCIVIEITEGLLLNAEDSVIDKLLKLREVGIQVAIDDFGTGYSSLAYLKKFHIDYLKIDRTFVSNLVTNENDMVLSEAIIIMAHKLGLKVIAEGVESERQSHMLSEAGCDYAQGYLYSKPVPPSKFELLLKNGFGDRSGDTVSGVG